jgi:hypothetical protein
MTSASTKPIGRTAAKEGGLGRLLLPGFAAVVKVQEDAAIEAADASRRSQDAAAEALRESWRVAREDEQALMSSSLVPVFKEIGEGLARTGNHGGISLQISDVQEQWSNHLYQATKCSIPTRPGLVGLTLMWDSWSGGGRQRQWREISGYCVRNERREIEGYRIYTGNSKFVDGLAVPTTITPVDLGRALDERLKSDFGYKEHTFDSGQRFRFMRTIAAFRPPQR